MWIRTNTDKFRKMESEYLENKSKAEKFYKAEFKVVYAHSRKDFFSGDSNE